MATGAQHGLIGDDYGTTLPETKVDEAQLTLEKKAAEFSRSAEFQKLKDHLESRIRYYQQYLPDGRALPEARSEDLGNMWLIANAIIGEFTAVLAAYEQARAAVEETVKDNVQRS